MVACKHLRNIVKHETLVFAVRQSSAFATDTFGDQNASNRRWPNHAGWVKLYEFHVAQLSTGPQGQSVAVAGVFPRAGTDRPAARDTAGGEHDRFCRKSVKLTLDTGVSNTAGDPVAFLEQGAHGVFHEDVNAFVDAAFLQRSYDLKTGSVADVSEAWEGVSAKVSLVDEVLWRAVKNSTPLLEFPHTVGGFFGVVLGHLPVRKPLAAFHRVVEVNFPAVPRVGVL